MSKRYPGGIIRKTPQTPSQTSAQGVWDMTSVTQAVKENTWPIAGVPDPISKSLRFRSSASAYLSRTFGTPTNPLKWTWSGWVKRSNIGSNGSLIAGVTSGSVYSEFRFVSTDILRFHQENGATTVSQIDTVAVFRDPSAWYHVVCVYDSANATTANRLLIYINGVLQTTTAVVSVPLNQASNINKASEPSTIGNLTVGPLPFDGYMTEVYFIDGQALTPSSFGNTNDQTGVWQPIAYTGTYGTNGFYLPFSNTASTTTLGYDFSGNSNNWTTNNISLTSGVTYDSMVDVPTQWIPYNTAGDTGGLYRGNYCVLNPLTNVGIGTVSNGNLQLATTTNSRTMTGTMALPSTGQYYFEITATDYVTDGGTYLGIVNQPFITTTPTGGSWLGFNTYSATYENGSTTDTNGLTGTNVTQDGDIWCIAVDMTNGKFWIGRSRSGTLVWADGVTPAVNGSGATTLSLPTGTLYPMAYRGGSFNEIYNFNFGQRPFTHTPPSGFNTLNTTNLPTPTIGATASTTANKYFNANLYTGNGTTNAITNVGFQPDFVWVKSRSDAYFHGLYDAVRGAGSTKGLYSNDTAAEGTYSDFQNLVSFDSNGFTLGATSNTNNINANASTFVGWNWRASNATAVTNTAGSITSTVSANTTAGFSIVTWTGNGGSSESVGTGLSTTSPIAMAIVKRRSGTSDWWVGHQGIQGSNFAYRVLLNSNDANSGSSPYVLGSQSSTNGSLLYLATEGAANAVTYVAYCFQQVAGYSAFGSYTGNGSSDGTFVYTGFRPRFVMIKQSNSANYWWLKDSARSPTNQADLRLAPNLSNAESNDAAFNGADFLSNGFKLRGTDTTTNQSGGTYIYVAFAESPFKYALAR